MNKTELKNKKFYTIEHYDGENIIFQFKSSNNYHSIDTIETYKSCSNYQNSFYNGIDLIINDNIREATKEEIEFLNNIENKLI